MPDLGARIETLAEWMYQAERLVVFTGAGISTDSGLPDFRGPDGVWTRRDAGLPPRDTGDWTASEPNAAHHAVVELDRLGKLHFVVSQNIDNLHLAAGLRAEILAELHGNLALARCRRCERTYPKDALPARCDCGASDFKSSVVDFGDSLPVADLNAAFDAAKACDLMIVLGSSLVVTPAADVPRTAQRYGARLVIVNRGETPLDSMADLRFEEGIKDVFPPAVSALARRLEQSRHNETPC